MNPFPLRTPEERATLDPRDKPYFVRVTDSVHLGYRKGKSVRRWIVRWRASAGYMSHTFRGAIPDDEIPANGLTVLSYEQALMRAMNMNIEATNRSHIKHCSFCSKPQTEVTLLIAGPSTYICDQCVGLCNDIIEGHKAEEKEDTSSDA